MIEATRRWFRRNRNSLLVGAGVIGAGYIAGQYVLGRIREASQRMKDDKSARENLRGRFERNQDDCTFTVLALLPTVRDEIINALPVEQITEQLQQERQDRLKRLAVSEAPSSEYPSAPASIVDDASTASFVHTSQMGMSALEDSSKPKKSKAQLWQDMKINSIARALSLLYTLSLLTLLTRIQLNLLGRRTYLASVVSMANPAAGMQSSTISLEDRDDMNFDNAYGSDFETNRMYLTFSWWILHRGAKKILDRVMAAVKEVFAGVNIREDMTMERLSELIIEVRRRVEGATEQERRQQSWLEYLLPPRSDELFVITHANQADSSDSASPEPETNAQDATTISPSLRRLLDETADLIDSPTFSLVLGHLLDTGFSHLVDVRIASEAFKANIPQEGARISEITDTRCKLAHILPVFCRQAHAIVAGVGELESIGDVANGQQSTNEYLTLMDRVHDLEAFAAVIYSSNFEYEVVESPRVHAQQQQDKVESLPLQQSIVSLADSQLEKLDLSQSIDTENKSQLIDPLGESAVAIEKADLESSAGGPDFESAWTKALGSEPITQTSGELVSLPVADVEPEVNKPESEAQAQPNSASVVVPTMEAASELAPASSVEGQQSAQSQEPVQSVQSRQPAQSVQSVQPTQPVQSTQPAQSTQPVQSTQPAQSTHSVQSGSKAIDKPEAAQPERSSAQPIAQQKPSTVSSSAVPSAQQKSSPASTLIAASAQNTASPITTSVVPPAQQESSSILTPAQQKSSAISPPAQQDSSISPPAQQKPATGTQPVLPPAQAVQSQASSAATKPDAAEPARASTVTSAQSKTQSAAPSAQEPSLVRPATPASGQQQLEPQPSSSPRNSLSSQAKAAASKVLAKASGSKSSKRSKDV